MAGFNLFKKLNRTQTIQIGEHLQTILNSPCGVPQGSVLGPHVFLLYINILTSIPINYPYLFADDTNHTLC